MTAKLRILQSFPTPRPTTNPYLIMLADSLRAIPGVEVMNFSWHNALREDYDVFHVHWPEILVSGQSPAKKLARQSLFAALLARLGASRTPLVRTVHNIELPSGISRREVFLLGQADQRTTLRVVLNSLTPVAPDQPHELILHGHYRDWFAQFPRHEQVRGRVAYFGQIRGYKGVDRLITAFREIPESTGLSLSVAGRPSSEAIGTQTARLAAADSRVQLALGYQSDPDLVRWASQSELVVLPYREMHNSGGALAALSMDRPVLVPENQVNRLLAEEVGPGWVYCYDGEITAATIEATVDAVRADSRAERPDLSQRDWGVSGRKHVAAYERAIELAAK